MKKILPILFLILATLGLLFNFYTPLRLWVVINYTALKSKSDPRGVIATIHTPTITPKTLYRSTVSNDCMEFKTNWVIDKTLGEKTSKIVKFTNDKAVILHSNQTTSVVSQVERSISESVVASTALKKNNVNNTYDLLETIMSIKYGLGNFSLDTDKAQFNFFIQLYKLMILMEAEEVIKYPVKEYTIYQYKPFKDKFAYEILLISKSTDKYCSMSVTGLKTDPIQNEIDELVSTITIY